MKPQHFLLIHNWLSKIYNEILFTFRSPKFNKKKGIDNYSNYRNVVSLSNDEVKRYVTSILWRTNSKKEITRPILLYLFGFDIFAFGIKGIVNNMRKGARTVYDIEKEKLKFFNRKTMCLEYGKDINKKCICPIHKGLIISSSILDIYETEIGAILASSHDMHEINSVFKKIIEGKMKREDILKNKIYSELMNRIINIS